MARVIGGAVLLRRSQQLIAWRSDFGVSDPGWLVHRRWCSVVSGSAHPIGHSCDSWLLKSIARPWLYCQLWLIFIMLTCLTKGRDVRYLPKFFQSTMWKMCSSHPCFFLMYSCRGRAFFSKRRALCMWEVIMLPWIVNTMLCPL